MFVGKVVGTVWSTVKWPGVSGHKLLLVRPYHLADLLAHPAATVTSAQDQSADLVPANGSAVVDAEAVVCIDLMDAGVGDDVLVAFGHAARVAADPSLLEPARTQSSSGLARLAPPQANPPVTPIDAAVVAVVDGFHIVRPGT